MTDLDFRKALGGFNLPTIITGVSIGLFGAGLFALAITGADQQGNGTGQKIFLILFGVLCAAIGGLILFVQIRTVFWIRGGRHPLINAIAANDSAFVIRFYEHAFKVRNGGTNYQIWIICRGNRRFIINLGLRNTRSEDIMNYLAAKFPSAAIGFTKDN